jgi:CheY-like chemotaxis protein
MGMGRIQKILYVQRDDVAFELAAAYIGNKCELKRARNRDEAFNLLTREKFDVILLGIQTKDLAAEGIDICRSVKNRLRRSKSLDIPPGEGPAPQVVFVSRYTPSFSREILLRIGGDEVVTDPVDLTRLDTFSSGTRKLPRV